MSIQCDIRKATSDVTKPCPVCNGSGTTGDMVKIDDRNTYQFVPCPECSGMGRVEKL